LNPLLLLGIPAAIALAWFALRGGGQPSGPAVSAPAVDGALEPGATGTLIPSEAGEDAFKRFPLEMTGGEVGGPYGPTQNGQAPSAPVDGSEPPPEPTQTFVTAGGAPISGADLWGFVTGGPTTLSPSGSTSSAPGTKAGRPRDYQPPTPTSGGKVMAL